MEKERKERDKGGRDTGTRFFFELTHDVKKGEKEGENL